MPRVSLLWVILFAAVAIGAVVWGWDQRLQATAAELRVDVELKSVAGGAQRVAELERRVAVAEAARAKAEGGRSAGNAAAAPGSANGERKQVHLRDLVRDHPELEAVRTALLRQNALRQYGIRLAKLNLPPDQLDKVKDLLVERQLAYGDAAEAARAAGIAENSPEFGKAVSNAQLEVQNEIAEVIGKDQARDLIGGANFKYQVDTYNTAMSEAGADLSSDQQIALANMLYETTQAPQPGRRASSFYQPDPTTGLTGGDEQVLQQASGILSPAQLAALRQAMATKAKQDQVMQQLFKSLPSGTSIIDD